MGLNVISTGFEKAITSIRSIRELVDNRGKRFIRKKGEEFVNLAQEYPPETEANRPPPPFYTRTNTLKDGWQRREEMDRYLIENVTPYALWVHGTSKQAWFHKARGWKTVKDFLSLIGLTGDENGTHVITELVSYKNEIIDEIKHLFI